MTWIDWLVVGVVMAGLGVVGWRVQRMSRSVAHYTVAGRQLGMWLMMSSGMAGGIGLVSIVAMAQTGFNQGLSFIWITLFSMLFINIPLFGILGLGVMRYRATNVQTLPQYYEMRFSRSVRLFAGITLVIGGVLNMAVFPIVESHVLVAFLGLPETFVILGVTCKTVLVLLFILLAMAVYFAVMGGMVSVTVTEYLQSWIMAISLGALLYFVLARVGVARAEQNLVAVRGDSAFNPFAAGSLGIAFVFTVIAQNIVSKLAFPPSLQVTSSMRNPRIVRISTLLTSIFGISAGLAFVAFGIAALAMFGPDVPADPAASEIYQRALVGRMAAGVLPTVFMGLALSGFICASISTNDAYLLSWGSVLCNDVICPIRSKPYTPEEHIRALRWTIVGIAVFIFFFGVFYTPKESVLQFFYMTGAIFSGCGLITWFGLYWRRASAAGAWAALVLAVVLPVGWMLFRQFAPGAIDESWAKENRVQDWVTLGALVIPALAMVAVSLATGGTTKFVDYGERLREIQQREASAKEPV